MRETKVYCDRCKKELSHKFDYFLGRKGGQTNEHI